MRNTNRKITKINFARDTSILSDIHRCWIAYIAFLNHSCVTGRCLIKLKDKEAEMKKIPLFPPYWPLLLADFRSLLSPLPHLLVLSNIFQLFTVAHGWFRRAMYAIQRRLCRSKLMFTGRNWFLLFSYLSYLYYYT